MLKSRRSPERAPWPWGNDTRADRLAVYARMCWDSLAKLDPVEADRIRRFAAHFGDEHLINPPPDTAAPGQPMTRQQVAELANVEPAAVTMWASRGIRRGGQRYRLVPRRPGEYDPDDVTAFLQVRDGAVQPAEAMT
ncbi:hypothetical protein [Pseudonocardia sp. T1-2H]|uniref:hypothetical protein n=1 Tax=Pseudonocardia sp. T1-2H TaxID=3128899 RepID=UPI003100F9A2